MTYAQALAALAARQEARVELGLARMRAHLARLGDPQERVPCFHVAGTNGKGSTCAMLDAVLRAAGLKVGLYISPHLLSPRERARVNGRPISERAFADATARALAADPDGTLTYFELTTSIAFQHFAASACDVAVLETGLGGRLDATNVVSSPLAAVVTSIDFDHMSYLGNTLSKIAGEKAAIFKAGRPAVYPDLPAAAAAVVARAARRGVPTPVRRAWKTTSVDWARGRQTLRAPGGRFYLLSLLGARQGRNAALARAALDASGLAVTERAWRRGLASVRWPGRFEPVRLGRRTLIVDGAHNPEAARALAATWRAAPWSRRPARWILGLLRDKDAAGVLAPLARYLRDVVVVRPDSPRALEPLALAAAVRRAAPRARVTVEPSVAAALSAWRADRNSPTAAVCAGSLYLAGAALAACGRGA
ncbi:MAG: bifunctional folylpolyglutamate synthase/dihydrofolate synthase [Elusimicrobia bacterium]|nr:bifunctional folylpolyglutamate synthase/dihydrofolate synthase [Elusimicrobiota bacterium]